MKRIFALLAAVLLGGLSLMSCATNLPIGDLAADHLVQIRNHEATGNATEIKQKIIEFITLTFVSAKDVVQVNENAMVTGNWTTEIYKASLNSYNATISFIITVNENKVNVKYVVKSMRYWAGQYGWYDLERQYWGAFQPNIDKSINDVDGKLSQFLQ